MFKVGDRVRNKMDGTTGVVTECFRQGTYVVRPDGGWSPLIYMYAESLESASDYYGKIVGMSEKKEYSNVIDFNTLLNRSKDGALAEVILLQKYRDRVKWCDNSAASPDDTVVFLQSKEEKTEGELRPFPKFVKLTLSHGYSAYICPSDQMLGYRNLGWRPQDFANDARAILAELERCGLIKKQDGETS